MTQELVAETLKSLPHFHGLPQELMERIVAASRLLRVDAGGQIFREGEPTRAFFAVRRGTVQIHRVTPDGREQILHRIRAGQTFAEAAALTMPRFPANAVALEDGTEVVEIGADTFGRIFSEDPRLARGMVGALCTWLHRLVGRVEELSVLSAGARLARYLLDLPGGSATDEAGEPATEVVLPMAKKDLAAYLGITPETLSRVLRKWQDRDIVESRRDHIVIRDVETLLAIASDADTAG